MKLLATDIKKIAVFRALQLGDMLNAVPAVRALRNAYPKAEITLIGLPWAQSFVKRFHHYFNKFIHFPGYPGLPEQPFDQEKYKLYLQQVRNENFDLLLQMQGNGTIVNEMLLQWNAKYLGGYYNDQSGIESPLFMRYPDFGSEIHRHLLLMEHLGLSLLGDELEFPVTDNDEAQFDELNVSIEKKSYVCVHPGSRGAWRQWPPEYFARLADVCVEHGLHVVVTGTDEEKNITQRVIEKMKYPAADLTGKTSLGSIAVLIKNASLLIANCTGVSHIASATQTPSIIISMDSEPERWSPLRKDIHFVTDWIKFPDIRIPLRQLHNFLNEPISQKIKSESKENFVSPQTLA